MDSSPFVQWLLEARTPSLRLLTLTQLLHHSINDIDVRASWGTMKASGPIPAILSHQTKTGNWSGESGFYTPKYRSTHWSMLLLTELATDPQDIRLRRGGIFMLGTTWDKLEEKLEKKRHGWTCLWANMLRYILHCRLDDDPRFYALTQALIYDALQAGWRCPYNGERPCAWGAVRTLWALAAMPQNRSDPEFNAVIQSGLHFLLEQHTLTSADYPTGDGGDIHPIWFRMNFPLFYQADILFTLRTLSDLSALDHPGAQPALDWLEEKRMKNGRWQGSSPFRSRTWVALGDHEETNRWVSIHAAMVLRAAGRQVEI